MSFDLRGCVALVFTAGGGIPCVVTCPFWCVLQLRRGAVDCIEIDRTGFRGVGRICGTTLLQSLAGGECCFRIVDPSLSPPCAGLR